MEKTHAYIHIIHSILNFRNNRLEWNMSISLIFFKKTTEGFKTNHPIDFWELKKSFEA